MNSAIELMHKAREFAHAAHDAAGQKRKYSGDPYWTHTDDVANIVGFYGEGSAEMIAAAHLHDVLEDVPSTLPVADLQFLANTDEPLHYDSFTIGRLFGAEVVWLVLQLTEVFTKEKYPELNRAERKEAEAKRLTYVSNWAKTIKLADLLSNAKDIEKHDPDFAVVYMKEKERLLQSLVGGHPTLWNAAAFKVKEFNENKGKEHTQERLLKG